MEAIHPKYKTFWERLGASILDAIVLSPIFYIVTLGIRDQESALAELLVKITAFVLMGGYSVYMTGKYGATFGKMLTGIIVLDGDDEKSTIGLARALKRDAPLIISEVLVILYMIITIDDNPYGYDSKDPVISIIDYLGGIWLLAELITMFRNERRRAIHDILANSVVVMKKLNITVVP